MEHGFPRVDAKRHTQLAADIDTQGYACVPGYLTDAQLSELRSYLQTEAEKHPGSYFSYHGKELFSGTLLGSLHDSSEFNDLLSGVLEKGINGPAQSKTVFQVLRCTQGETGLKESNCFHYDATLLTALVPIEIPTEGEQRGDLMLFPNLRKVRSSVLFNVIEKALLQNVVARKLTLLGIRLGLLKPLKLQLVPGNLYLFWGYRSLHANEPCDPKQRRATALFHYSDPHAFSLLTGVILLLNQQRAKRASRNGQHAAL